MEKGLFSTGWKIMEMAQLPDIMGLEIVKLNIYGKYLQVLNWAITYYPFTLTKDKRSVVLYFIDLIIYDFDYWGKLGSFQAEFLYKNKKLNENELNFRIEMSSINTTRKNDVNGFANYLVTLGHEMFIHMEQWYVKYLVSFLKNDKKEFDRLMDISNKDGGDYDHSRYINGNENYKFFNTYLQQLKKNEHIANNAKINR